MPKLYRTSLVFLLTAILLIPSIVMPMSNCPLAMHVGSGQNSQPHTLEANSAMPCHGSKGETAPSLAAVAVGLNPESITTAVDNNAPIMALSDCMGVELAQPWFELALVFDASSPDDASVVYDLFGFHSQHALWLLLGALPVRAPPPPNAHAIQDFPVFKATQRYRI